MQTAKTCSGSKPTNLVEPAPRRTPLGHYPNTVSAALCGFLCVCCCCARRVTQTRAFDTEPASSSYASGFIVDRARGIILTNRHVVTPGACVFGNRLCKA